jgi:hypothetical protein
MLLDLVLVGVVDTKNQLLNGRGNNKMMELIRSVAGFVFAMWFGICLLALLIGATIGAIYAIHGTLTYLF